jgi:hypothetical protein
MLHDPTRYASTADPVNGLVGGVFSGLSISQLPQPTLDMYTLILSMSNKQTIGPLIDTLAKDGIHVCTLANASFLSPNLILSLKSSSELSEESA